MEEDKVCDEEEDEEEEDEEEERGEEEINATDDEANGDMSSNGGLSDIEYELEHFDEIDQFERDLNDMIHKPYMIETEMKEDDIDDIGNLFENVV